LNQQIGQTPKKGSGGKEKVRMKVVEKRRPIKVGGRKVQEAKSVGAKVEGVGRGKPIISKGGQKRDRVDNGSGEARGRKKPEDEPRETFGRRYIGKGWGKKSVWPTHQKQEEKTNND